MAPPGFCNTGEVRYGSIGGLEYEVPQSRLYCLCINVALCSTALQCICRVIRRSSVAMKAHTYYIIFGRPPIGGKLPPPPSWWRHWSDPTRLCRRRPETRIPKSPRTACVWSGPVRVRVVEFGTYGTGCESVSVSVNAYVGVLWLNT